MVPFSVFHQHQHVESLAGRCERSKVELLGRGAGHQVALDLAAVEVVGARAESLQRMAGCAPPAETAEVKFDEGRVVGEHRDGKLYRATRIGHTCCACPNKTLHDQPAPTACEVERRAKLLTNTAE